MQSKLPPRFLPPKDFREVVGLEHATFASPPPFLAGSPKCRGSKKRGLIYEARVSRYLDRKYAGEWVGLPACWIKYSDKYGEGHYAQPDWIGINVSEGIVCVAEMKLTRVSNAWWQLNKKYKPLVQHLFPAWPIALLEIASVVKSLALPEEVRSVQSLDNLKVGQTCFMKVPYDV